jgi:hypothetical protein
VIHRSHDHYSLLLRPHPSSLLPPLLSLRSYRGEIMTGIACALQYRTSKSEMVGGRLTLGSKSRAGLSVKIKSQERWWAGLIAMALPLGTLLLQSLGLVR